VDVARVHEAARVPTRPFAERVAIYKREADRRARDAQSRSEAGLRRRSAKRKRLSPRRLEEERESAALVAIRRRSRKRQACKRDRTLRLRIARDGDEFAMIKASTSLVLQ
jgi:hypothetical protein